MIKIVCLALVLCTLAGFKNSPQGQSPANETAFSFTMPKNVEVSGYNKNIMEPFISRDGQYLFFNDETRLGKDKDIFWAERVDDYLFNFRGEVAGVNSETVDGTPAMDRDNNFYFISVANYSEDNKDTVYTGTFKDGAVSHIRPVTGITNRPFGWICMDVEISADGQTLYGSYADFRKGAPPQSSYLFIARRQGENFVMDPRSEELLEHINKDKTVYAAAISADERELFYTRADLETKIFEMMRAVRQSADQPFGEPEVVSTVSGIQEGPAFSVDGRIIYYHHKPSFFAPFRLMAIERTNPGQ